jgi:glycine cleavage system aminomethyltransferase T
MIDYIGGLAGGFSETREIKGSEVVYVANSMEADYGNIRNGVGIFPFTAVSFYKVAGDGAEEALDRLLTKDIQYLNYGQNRMCYFLDDAGEISAMVTVYKNDDNFVIEAFNWDEGAVAKILNGNGLSWEKLDYSCILMEGVQTVDFIADELSLAVDYFVYQSHQDMECFGHDVTVARTGYTGEYGYKLIGGHEAVKAIWKELLPAHKDKVAGYAAFEMCQYEIKQPFWELPWQALSKNIFETDYQWLVDFKKDIDYVGKDALYSVHSKNASRRLIGAISEAEIGIGDGVLLESENIGKVVDSRFSIGLQKYISMLFIDKEYAHANIPLATVGGKLLDTASAPYAYPSSWSVKK